MGTTTTKGVPYPVPSDPPDVPADMGLLATWVDGAPGVGIFTTSQRDALAFPALWAGRTIYNTTTGRVEAYTAIGWLPVGGYVQVLNQGQRDALPLKPAGFTVFNTDAVRLQTYDGNRWQDYGFMPNLTTTARDALTAGQKQPGQIIWNTTNGVHEAWNGTSWGQIAGGAGAGSTGAAGIVGFTSTLATGAAIGGTYTTLLTLTFAGLPGRRYRASGYVNGTKDATAGGVNVEVFDGLTLLAGPLAELYASGVYMVTAYEATVATGAAARTITITVQIQSAAGSWTPARGFLIVEDVGADTQVATPVGIVNPNVWNTAWGVVARATSLSTASGITTDTDVLTTSYTAVAGRRYRYSFIVNFTNASAGGNAFAKITDGSNVVLQAGTYGVNAAQNFTANVWAEDTTGTAVTRTIKGRVSAAGGTITLQGGTLQPHFLMVEDMGPLNPTAPDTWPPNPLPGIWTAVTLLNSWANYLTGYQACQYRKVGDIVYVRGTIKSGTTTIGTVLFTLPTGYRPPASVQFAQEAASAHAAIEARANGDVVINSGSNMALSLAFEFSTVA